MSMTAQFCRDQERAQRDRAAAASLANTRVVAERAAMAWAGEARFAEAREAREARQKLARSSSVLHICQENDISENPDRGFADA